MLLAACAPIRIAVAQQNPATLYAASSGSALRSTDGGVTFLALSLPSSQVSAIANVVT
jgi:hypothetical protein